MTARNISIPAPQRTRTYLFAVASDAVVTADDNGMAPEWGCGEFVSRCRLAVASAPTGSSLIVRLDVIDPTDGSVIRTASTTFAIAAAAKTGGEQTFTPMLVDRLYQLKATVTQVGGTLPGTGLSIAVD